MLHVGTISRFGDRTGMKSSPIVPIERRSCACGLSWQRR